MLANEATLMVIGSEALRLKLFLLANKLPVPLAFHRVAATSSEAAEDRVSHHALVDALQTSVQVSHNPGLAIDFGASIRLADMGIYGMVILTGATLRDALERSVRFSRLMTGTGRVHLAQAACSVKWVWSNTDLPTLGARMRNEVVLTEHVAVVRALMPGAVPRSVSLIHSEPEDTSRHRQFFGCDIVWSADDNSVQWPEDILKTPLGVDASLGDFIEKEAVRRMALLPSSNLVDTMTDAIQRRLASGDVSLQGIAAALGRSPRSLRRELSDAGCVYRTLVDSVRRQRAQQLAGDAQYSMTDVALKLGFSELSAFSRAWRRWYNGVPFRAKKKTDC